MNDDDFIRIPRRVAEAYKAERARSWGCVRRDDTLDDLRKAIDDALWTPPVATIPWVRTAEHQPPLHKQVLLRDPDGLVLCSSSSAPTVNPEAWPEWCLLPEKGA